MPSPQDIVQYQERLAVYRANLATLLTQQAPHTSAFVPPAVVSGIREAREGIERYKAILRGWGVPVEDLPDDGMPLQSVPPASHMNTASPKLPPRLPCCCGGTLLERS